MNSSTLSRHSPHIFVGSRSFVSICEINNREIILKSFVCDVIYRNTYTNSNASEYFVAQIVWARNVGSIAQNVYEVMAK